MTNPVVATFALGDVNGATPTDFKAMINWGDSVGTGDTTSGSVVESSPGIFEVTANHTYFQATVPGTPDLVTVTVSNSSGTSGSNGPASVTSSATAVVLPQPLANLTALNLSESKGKPFTTEVASFSDPNQASLTSSFSASINWGDSTSSVGTITTTGTPQNFVFHVQGSHTYAISQSAPFITTVTVNDLVNGQTVQSSSVNGMASVPVTPPAISPTSQVIVATAGVALPTNTLVGSLTYNPGAIPPNFTATINWGDGHINAISSAMIQQVGTSNVYDIFASNTFAVAGSYAVAISVADQFGNANTINSTANVLGSVVNPTKATFAVTPGTTFTGTVATFTDSNPLARITLPTATIDWGDGHETLGTVKGPDANGIYTVTGTNSYAPDSSKTMYTVTVTITDPTSQPVQVESTAIVTGTPVFSPTSQVIIATAKQALPPATIVGTFVYTPAPNSSPTFSATIDWGDGHVIIGQVVLNNGVYDVEGTNTYNLPGNYPIKVTVTDGLGNASTINSLVEAVGQVINAIGTSFSITPGTPFTGVVATFTDTDPLALTISPTALIDWGDGNKTLGKVTQSNGLFTVTGTNTYQPSGRTTPYMVTVSITDPNGAPANQVTSSAYPTGPAFTPTGQAIVATANMPLPANTVVGSFSYVNPSGPAIPTFTATINWGDGQVTSGTVVKVDSNDYLVEAPHTYATSGQDTVLVSVADSVGNSTTITSKATVIGSPINATGVAIGVVPGQPFSGTVATFTDSDPLASTTKPTATITWMTGIVTPGVVTGPDAKGQFTVSGTFNYGSNPMNPLPNVIVAINGPGNDTGTATTPAFVLTSSTLRVTGTTFAVNPDSPFTGTVATFTDLNPAAATSKPTATIDWGDGTVTAGVVTGPDANNIYTVTGSIIYLSPGLSGNRQVTVTVTDPSGVFASATSTALMSKPMSAPTLTGGLDGGGENGPSASLGFTNTNRPTFSGATTPFALVQLYARRIDVDATLPLGQTIADGTGHWSMGTGPLSGGIFNISAIVTDAGGSPTGPLPLGTSGLYTIDTIPPTVLGATSDGKGHIYVSFRDDLSGMSLASLMTATNYTLSAGGSSAYHPMMVVALPNAGLATDIQTVELTIVGKARFNPKSIRITAAGVVDNAGNRLGKDFHGTITHATGRASSNVVVKVTVHKPKLTKHHR